MEREGGARDVRSGPRARGRRRDGVRGRRRRLTRANRKLAKKRFFFHELVVFFPRKYLGRLVVRAKTRASSLAPLRAPPRRAAHFGMREIITACVGGAGNKLGARFFRELCAEHGVRPSGFLLDPDDASRGAFATSKAAGFSEPTAGAGRARAPPASPPASSSSSSASSRAVFFREGKRGRHVPRAVLCDLEPRAVDAVTGGALGGLFRPDGVVCDRAGVGAGGNFAAAYHGASSLADRVVDAIRREAEACDALQGFLFVHALGGGAGAGLASALLERVADKFPDVINCSMPLFPDRRRRERGGGSDAVLEPLNAALGVPALTLRADIVVPFDNAALRAANDRGGGSSREGFEFGFASLDALFARFACGITATLRFPGARNASLRKLATNLVPFPRLHFLRASHAPLLEPDEYLPFDAERLLREAFSRDNIASSVFDDEDEEESSIPSRSGRTRGRTRSRTLAAFAVVRGEAVAEGEVEDAARRLAAAAREEEDARRSGTPSLLPRERPSSSLPPFVRWLPEDVQFAMCAAPPASPRGADASATALANLTSARRAFDALRGDAAAVVRRGAFLHRFREAGMDDEELAEAIAVLAELDAEYGQYETSEERESGVGWAAWKTPPRREAEEDKEEEGTFGAGGADSFYPETPATAAPTRAESSATRGESFSVARASSGYEEDASSEETDEPGA